MKEIKLDHFTLFIRNPDVILREEEPDGALLFNPDTNQIRVINTTGLFIWNHCDGTLDLGTIIETVKESFEGVPEDEVDNQIHEFVEDMRANGFLGIPIAMTEATIPPE